MAGTSEQMVVIFRRTSEGGWEVGGDIGEPGAAHATRLRESIREVDFDRASFAAGVCAGLIGLDVGRVREFGAMPEAS